MPRNEEDEKLIQEIRSGNKRKIEYAVETLFEQNWSRVEKIVRIGGGSETEVRTILHDAILEVLSKIRRGAYDAEKASLQTLLYSIAKYKWLNELKRFHRISNSESKLNENSALQKNPIEEEIFTQEEREKMVRALKQLDPSCRRLFQMKYLDGISLRIIAQRLETSEDAVKQRHKRCKDKLRRILGDDPRIENGE